MAVTSDSYTGNGSTTTYSFTFPYLKQADVKVKVNGTTQNTTTYSLPTATTLQFNTAPANGAAILIFRDTDNTTRAANFYSGSAIKATDLNENFDQILYTAQEVDENALSAQGDDPMQGDLSMGNNKLTNLATPTATTDGANKTYVDSTIDTKIDTALTTDVVGGSSISIADNTPSSGKITLNVIAATGSNSGSLSASDKSKLDGIETGATADQTNAEIRAAVEAATDSNVFTDADHSKLNAIEASATADQTAAEIKTLLQSDKLTDSEIATGTLDGRYYTETEVDANFYKLGSAGEIASGETWTAADTKIATTAAIDARITDLVDDVGGFVPIANETSFPNANPDVNNGAGTLVSIKALSSNLTSNGSGVATIANGTVGNSTVTITGLANSTTYAATFGMIVETTSTLNTYTFHRQVPKATEVTTVAGSISNINAVGNNTTNINTVAGATSNISTVAGAITNVNNVGGSIANVNTVATNISSVNDFAARYRIASSDPSSNNDTGDLVFNTTSNELRVYNGSAWQGGVTATGNLLSKAGDQMTGNLTFSGSQTVDGRDVSVDGTKLDTIATNANNYTHPNHTGEVTSSADGAQTIADNVVDEANLKVSNSPTNGQFLQAQSGNTGGLTWAAIPAGVGGSTGVDFNDNVKARFGTGNDLEIFHSSGDNYINCNSGHFFVRMNNGTENAIFAEENGPVQLYHNQSQKLATSSSGVTITGTATATTFSGSGASLTNLPAANLTGTLPAISGANLTSLNATNLGSGTVPTARLGSGTANSSKVLMGNSTWGDLPASSSLAADDGNSGSSDGSNRISLGTQDDTHLYWYGATTGGGCYLQYGRDSNANSRDSNSFFLTQQTSGFSGTIFQVYDSMPKLSWYNQNYNNGNGRWEDAFTAGIVWGTYQTSNPYTNDSNLGRMYSLKVFGKMSMQMGNTESTIIGHEAGMHLDYSDYGWLPTHPAISNATFIGTKAGFEATRLAGQSYGPWGPTAIGSNAARYGTDAEYYTAVGTNAASNATTAYGYVAVGLGARAGTTSDYNVSVGNNSGPSSTGAYNTCMGNYAGGSLTTGDNNLLLGNNAGHNNSPGGQITTQDNNVVLGNNSIQNFYCADTSISSSDSRDKTDITDFTHGLKWINQLKPITYRWDKRVWYNDINDDGTWTQKTPDGTRKRARQHIGFLAQDVLAIEQADGYASKKDDMLIVNLNEDDTAYGLKYERLVPVLVNAVKELSAKVTALEAK